MNISLPQVKKPQGIVIYRGPSLLNGKPIVVIVTGFKHATANPKTGDMLQSWIVTARSTPIKQYVNGGDDTICGNCKHRSKASGGWGTCYVSVWQAPNNVHAAWRRGVYEELNDNNVHFFDGQHVRLGSYGDPAAVPTKVWERITANAKGWTGYTHQWNNPNIDKELKKFCMASADTEVEKLSANAQGWRTFRIRASEDDPIMKGEFVCPASYEGGQKLTCNECGACKGGEHSKKGEPVIIMHGRKFKIKRFEKITKARKQKKKYTHLI